MAYGILISQFLAGGEALLGDQLAGIRTVNGVLNDYKITFPGTGIRDSAGKYMLRWFPGSGINANYVQTTSASSTFSPTLQAAGADVNVNLQLLGQGSGYVYAGGTRAFGVPYGTTAQELDAFLGAIRLDTDIGYFQVSVDGINWVDLAEGGGGVTTINGTVDQIDVAGTNPTVTLSLSSTLVLPGTLTTAHEVTLSSLTAYGVLGLDGSSNINSTLLGAGQILVGTTSGGAIAAAIASGTGILVGNSSGAISVALAAIGTLDLLANLTGGSAAPTAHTLTAIIDACIGSTQGDILYRGASSWSVLAPGTSGYVLTTKGASANPEWDINPAYIAWQAVQTSNFNANAGDGYAVDTTSNAVTATLPASPSTGNIINFTDYAGTFASNNLTINPNGKNINGLPASIAIQNNREAVQLVYIDATQGWLAYGGLNTSTAPSMYSASYLIVGGGGGGGSGWGGGGGAGGLLSGTESLTVGTTYNFVIGDGGNGGTSGAQGVSGSNSTAFGLTGTGGGGGGGDSSRNGINGGSGGGAADANSAGSGSGGQGNNGGTGFSGAVSVSTGGGGGGATGVGGTGVSAIAGNGGAGTASSITGSSVTYAGGGGGGAGSGAIAGTGGTGGGGAGGADAAGTAATANTGGGGGAGGGHTATPQNGAAGGSGIIIVSVPTANYTGTITGSPTVTTSGSNTIMQFTSTGSYTA